MSECAECGADANNYCKWCEVAYCDECESEHDHGLSSGSPDFHEFPQEGCTIGCKREPDEPENPPITAA